MDPFEGHDPGMAGSALISLVKFDMVKQDLSQVTGFEHLNNNKHKQIEAATTKTILYLKQLLKVPALLQKFSGGGIH